MNTRTEPTAEPLAPGPAPEPRQRWRLTFARSVSSDGLPTTGREYTSLWEASLVDSGLPVAATDAGRLRFAFGAPLPAGTAALAELAELWLTERLPAWQVREALEPVLPPFHQLVGLEDIWLAAPALTGRVAAADYLVRLRGDLVASDLASACDRLMAADRLTRERVKGGGVKAYDLRPLLISVAVIGVLETPGDGPVAVAMRTRIHPELGSGRPEEVIAALAEEVGRPLETIESTRERLVMADDLDR